MNTTDPIAIVRPAVDLATLAAEINHHHEAGEKKSRERLEHYRKAGAALLRAREGRGHGGWLEWLEANVQCSRSRAYQYMDLAKLPVTGNLEEQEAEWRRISGNAPAEPEGAQPGGGFASEQEEQEEEPAPGRAFSGLSVAMTRANEAINYLVMIPPTDPDRKAGLKLVLDWIRANP